METVQFEYSIGDKVYIKAELEYNNIGSADVFTVVQLIACNSGNVYGIKDANGYVREEKGNRIVLDRDAKDYALERCNLLEKYIKNRDFVLPKVGE